MCVSIRVEEVIMTMLRWDPWSEVAALQRDVSDLMGRSVASGGGRGRTPVPAIDAFRDDEGLVVQVELAGLRPDDVEVTVEDGMLTIAGERHAPEVAEDAWVRRERAIGSFTRSFTLPEGTEPDAIAASFEHGVLQLRIPHPPARKPRRIRIEAADDQAAINLGSSESRAQDAGRTEARTGS
jgi:HSP20 family protein